MKWKPAAVGGELRSGHWHVYQFADGSWCARYWSGFEHEGGAGWVYPFTSFETTDEAVAVAEALSAPIMHRAEWEEP